MGLYGWVFAAKFRCHWRSWLLLSLLIGIASGFVLAVGAAARRTGSAFPCYVASRGYDARPAVCPGGGRP
ncbi:MAG TPA: hypothetical protein VGF32_10625 [Streptosporangiaceae bacterium]|jgi:hypothetical protein